MTENTYQPGCYGDGSFGRDHCTSKVFIIASDEGWKPELSEEEEGIYEHFFITLADPHFDVLLTADELIIIDELEQEAIDYLNEHCSDDSHYWGYDQGDFGYWEIMED